MIGCTISYDAQFSVLWSSSLTQQMIVLRKFKLFRTTYYAAFTCTCQASFTVKPLEEVCVLAHITLRVFIVYVLVSQWYFMACKIRRIGYSSLWPWPFLSNIGISTCKCLKLTEILVITNICSVAWLIQAKWATFNRTWLNAIFFSLPAKTPNIQAWNIKLKGTCSTVSPSGIYYFLAKLLINRHLWN